MFTQHTAALEKVIKDKKLREKEERDKYIYIYICIFLSFFLFFKNYYYWFFLNNFFLVFFFFLLLLFGGGGLSTYFGEKVRLGPSWPDSHPRRDRLSW